MRSRLSHVLLALALVACSGLALAKVRLGFSVEMATTDKTNTAIREIKVAAVHPGSAAEKAGLKPGDIITRLDGKPLEGTNPLAFQAALGGAAPGQHLKLLVMRAGKPMQVEVVAAQG
jgi:S1-C subfamily serine protease